MMNRRDVYRIGTMAMGSLMGLMLAVPGFAYLLDPVLSKRGKRGGGFQTLARLSQLTVGVPQAFPIIDERLDAWIKYPREPVGSVWLVRQPAGAKEPVVAFTAECPHLGGAIGLAADGRSFLCPYHNSNFAFQGKPLNQVPPRPMDTLAVKVSDDPDPEVCVKYERFQAASQEQLPLV